MELRVAKLRKREAHGRVQGDEHLFLTNQEPKREINSFYLPGTNAFPLPVDMSWMQLLKMYTLLTLSHMTSYGQGQTRCSLSPTLFLTPPDFEMNEIYTMHTKRGTPFWVSPLTNVSATRVHKCVLTFAVLIVLVVSFFLSRILVCDGVL